MAVSSIICITIKIKIEFENKNPYSSFFISYGNAKRQHKL